MAAAITRPARPASRREQSGPHWESWALRALMAAALVYQLATRNLGGATTLAEGVVVSLAPLLVRRFSRTHVPRLIELAFMLAMALQFMSESFKLFEIYYYWDKIVHPAEILLTTFAFALLLLGYVDQYELRMARPFAAAVAMLFGASLGTLW